MNATGEYRRAQCNGCERTKRLRKDGTFQRHTVRTLGLLCPGSGLTPAEANARNLWDEPRRPRPNDGPADG